MSMDTLTYSARLRSASSAICSSIPILLLRRSPLYNLPEFNHHENDDNLSSQLISSLMMLLTIIADALIFCQA